MKTSKFEIGKNYRMTFIGDADLRPVWTCISRTEKMAHFQKGSEIIKKRIKIFMDSEYVKCGSYSMAPSISAKRIVK